jgi:hypothetical protein
MKSKEGREGWRGKYEGKNPPCLFMYAYIKVIVTKEDDEAILDGAESPSLPKPGTLLPSPFTNFAQV